MHIIKMLLIWFVIINRHTATKQTLVVVDKE